MLIDSNNDCSTLIEQQVVRHSEDLINRACVKSPTAPLSDRSSPSNLVLDSWMDDPLLLLPAHQQSLVPRQDNGLSELQALRQVAYLGEQQKRRNSSIRQETIRSFDVHQLVGNFAAPISPLRERDVKALSELFLTDKMSEIEADVSHLLLRLQPEPCWEDDPFAFLQDFL
jgi:hypothetical protein